MFTHRQLTSNKEYVINTLKWMQVKSQELVELLYCCSYLHNKDIPDLLLEHFFKDKSSISDTIRMAEGNSLISINQNTKTFSIPEDVQDIIRDYLADENKVDTHLVKMANILYQAYPLKTTANTDRADHLLKKLFQPHLEKTLQYLNDYSLKVSQKDDKNKLNACILKHLIIYGDSYWYLGEIAKQKELLEKAYDIILNNDTDIDDHIRVFTSLGIANGATNNFEKAKMLLEDALLTEQNKPAKDNVNVAFISAYLGQVYVKLNMADKAQEFLENALKAYENISSQDQLTLAVLLNNLANAYSALKDHHKAIGYLQKSLSVKKAIYGDEHPLLAVTFLRLGMENKELGNRLEAEENLTKALNINDKAGGINNPMTFDILVNLCELSLINKDKVKTTYFLARVKQLCTDSQKESRLKKLEDNYNLAFKQELDQAMPLLKESLVTRLGQFHVTKDAKDKCADQDKVTSQLKV